MYERLRAGYARPPSASDRTHSCVRPCRELGRPRRFVTLLLVGALALWILPGWPLGMADRVREKPLQSLGWEVLGSAAIVGAVIACLLAAVPLAMVFGLLTLGGVAFWAIGLWALGSAALVPAYLILAAYLALGRGCARGRLLLRPDQTDRRTRAMLALAAGLVPYVVLRSSPIAGMLTGLIVVLLGVGAISGWLRRALRPAKPVTEEPSVDGPVKEKSMADEPAIKG